MNKIYCLNCNKPSIYESSKPAICGFCGKPYIASNANFTPILTKLIGQTKNVSILDDNETYDDIPELPNIENLEFEISSNLRPNRQHISKVGKGSGRTNTKTIKGKKISKKEIQENWANQFNRGTKENPINLGE